MFTENEKAALERTGKKQLQRKTLTPTQQKYVDDLHNIERLKPPERQEPEELPPLPPKQKPLAPPPKTPHEKDRKTDEAMKKIAGKHWRLRLLLAAQKIQEGTPTSTVKAGVFDFKYLPLHTLLTHCRASLAHYFLSFIQTLQIDQFGKNVLHTVLFDTRSPKEDLLKCSFLVPAGHQKENKDKKGNITLEMEDYQSVGKAITYVRRFSLLALLQIYPEREEESVTEREFKRRGA